jgi:hypothetical protein
MAFRNEYDFDSPEAIDFDILVERLKDIKAGYGHCYVSRCRLIMDQQSCRSACILFRETLQARANDHYLLSSCCNSRGDLCSARSASLGHA